MLNKQQPDNSSDNDSYDDCIPLLFNRCDLCDSSYYESDKCANVNNNEECSYKGLDYAEYLSEEDKYDENLMKNDEISDIIVGYKSDEPFTKGKDEARVIVCDEIKSPEENKYTYVSIVNSLSLSEKYFEWVVTVTNPKDERSYRVGKLGKWLEDTGESCCVIGIRDGINNQKYGSSQNFIVGEERKYSVTISEELEILPENT